MIFSFKTFQCIEYKLLQEGNVRSKCEIRFEKSKEIDPVTIYGQYDARQPENGDSITGFHFDVGMFPETGKLHITLTTCDPVPQTTLNKIFLHMCYDLA